MHAQHQNRRFYTVRSELFKRFHSIPARHRYIKQDYIKNIAPAQVDCLNTVRGLHYAYVFKSFAKELNQSFSYDCMIICDKDIHNINEMLVCKGTSNITTEPVGSFFLIVTSPR